MEKKHMLLMLWEFFNPIAGSFEVKFKETTISGPDKFYTFAYSNEVNNFDNQLSNI